MLWRNVPTVLLGRHQIAKKEVDLSFLKENDIKLVRRLSGGGAVYNDLSNFNFSFIVNNREDDSFRSFAEVLVKAMHSFGINLRFSGRNDLLLNQKKVSGNAQYHASKRMLHHGTVLYDVNEVFMQRALTVRGEKYQGRAVESVRSRVTTIRHEAHRSETPEEFFKLLQNRLIQLLGCDEIVTLTEDDLKAIETIREERFLTHEWNYGKDSDETRKTVKHAYGLLDIEVQTKSGIITKITFDGDFFSKLEVSELEEKLTHIPFDRKSIERALSDVDVDDYIRGASLEELVEDIINES